MNYKCWLSTSLNAQIPFSLAYFFNPINPLMNINVYRERCPTRPLSTQGMKGSTFEIQKK